MKRRTKKPEARKPVGAQDYHRKEFREARNSILEGMEAAEAI